MTMATRPGPDMNRAPARAAWLDANALIAEGVPPREVVQRLVDRHGIKRRQANRHVAAALLVLQADDEGEPIETKRARALARYEHLYRTAMERTRTVTYWVSKEEQAHEEVPDPDVATAGKMLGAIVMIQGVVPISAREVGKLPAPPAAPPAPPSGRTTVVDG